MPRHSGILGNGGLMGGVSDAIDHISGAPTEGGRSKFRRFLRETHIDSSFTDANNEVSVEDGEFTKAYQFTVPAQERYRWGYGSAEHPENQGYIYIDPVDDTVDNNPVNGSVRIQQRDAQERSVVTVEELEIEQLRASKSDRSMMVPLPEATAFDKVGRDSKLILAIDADSNTGIDWNNSEVILPVAVYPVRNV